MRKLMTLTAALIFGASLLCAQEKSPYDPTGRFYISIQGGPMYQSNENAFSYRYNDAGSKLFTYTAGAAVGYDFNKTWGVRGSLSYGLNRSACNTVETAAHGFYPYDFKSLNGFADVVLHFNGLTLNDQAFAPKLYAGIGAGHSFGFSKPTDYGTQRPADDVNWKKKYHPWQDVSEKNTAFGFRGGAILEYDFKGGLGLFLDVCGEAYLDNYNGLNPREEDHASEGRTGYAGFPFDLRASVSLGIVYHFR